MTTDAATPRNSPRRNTPQLNAAPYHHPEDYDNCRLAAQRLASLLFASQRNAVHQQQEAHETATPPCIATHRGAAYRNASPHTRIASPLDALLRAATQRSNQSLPMEADAGSLPTHHGSSLCSATPCTTTARNATRLTAAHCFATQRNGHNRRTRPLDR